MPPCMLRVAVKSGSRPKDGLRTSGIYKRVMLMLVELVQQ